LPEIPLAEDIRKEGDGANIEPHPPKLNAKVPPDVVFGVETDGQHRPREIVKRHRVTVFENSWEQLKWIGCNRDIANDPEDEEKWDKFCGEKKDHCVQGETESKHGGPSHHPINHDTRRPEVAAERCAEREV